MASLDVIVIHHRPNQLTPGSKLGVTFLVRKENVS
jgi:hypothetical protein